jgi:hypothetical protein
VCEKYFHLLKLTKIRVKQARNNSKTEHRAKAKLLTQCIYHTVIILQSLLVVYLFLYSCFRSGVQLLSGTKLYHA